MDKACGMNEQKRHAYRILVRNPEGKRPLGRPGDRWVVSCPPNYFQSYPRKL
jgi:hypothetical protein